MSLIEVLNQQVVFAYGSNYIQGQCKMGKGLKKQ